MTRIPWTGIAAVLTGFGAIMLPAAPAEAQAHSLVAPTLSAGAAFDDNLFSATSGKAVGDLIWRVSPGVSASRDSSRASWFGTYGLDAEMFRDHPTLTTPVARQSGSAYGRFRPSPSTTFSLTGAYDSTLTPSELNLTTALQAGRLRAWRTHVGPELKHAATSRTTLTLSYDFVDEAVSIGGQMFTHAGDFRLAHQLGTRDEFRVKSFVRDYIFNDAPSLRAFGGVAGWLHKITEFTALSVEAGPRFTQGAPTPEPEIDAVLYRRSGLSDASISYTRTLSTAVGLREPLRTQRLVGSASYRRVGFAEVGVQAGYYASGRGTASARVYRMGTDVTRRLGGVVSVSASYSVDLQQGRPAAPGAPALLDTFVTNPVGDAFGVITIPITNGPIRRSVGMVRLTVSPQLRPIAKPRDGDHPTGNPVERSIR